MPVNDPNLGIAFALVIGAGLATALGAAVVFFPSLVKLASRRVLASGLGLSAGVMIYVSFAEIFTKSNQSFVATGIKEDTAYLYATLCFFGGALFMLGVDFLVKGLSGHGHSHSHDHSIPEDNKDRGEEVNGQQCFTCSSDPVGDLEKMQNQAESIIRRENGEAEDQDSDRSYDADGDYYSQSQKDESQSQKDESQSQKDESLPQKDEEDPAKSVEDKKLIKMGMNTALAIGIHNFPEGLATFVAALDDPRVGAVLAIAIGIHNIPEGLCVALPIYYATGNRMKAFGWALLSGASEPIAALLGWAVLANSFSDTLYAVLFGLVSGMMVIISVRELLPTAHRYDPEDTVVTVSFILGMFIMALSLVLFVL